MKNSELLEKAKAVILQPESWIQGHSAKDTNGNPVDTYSPDAVKFCSLGALGKASSGDRGSIPSTRYLYESLESRFSEVSLFNDDPNTTHTDVLALFDKAIELAKKDETSP